MGARTVALHPYPQAGSRDRSGKEKMKKGRFLFVFRVNCCIFVSY